MAASEELKALVSRIPEPPKGGTYAELDEKGVEEIEKVLAELRKGGRQAALGLIDLLVEPGKGDDVKPHFALHLLAVRLSAPGNDGERAAFATALASQLGGARPKGVQSYLIEQLQVAGGKEVTAALGKALLDADLCDWAARALAAIGDGAAEPLLGAWPKVRGAGRLSVLKKLAYLRVPGAAGLFKQCLTDADADVRIAAAWGVARIADASAADALLKAADAHEGWERINQTDACVCLAAALAAAGNKATAARIYAHLKRTRTAPDERHIRQAAETAAAAL